MSEANDQAVIEGEFEVLDDAVDHEADLEGGAAREGGEPEDEELEDFDLDGRKVPLPKSVAEELAKRTMLHGDYTRKTQELGDQRRAFDTEKQTWAQSSRQIEGEQESLVLVRHQLAEFNKVDWGAAAARDAQNGTQEVTLARFEIDRLKEQATQLEQSIRAKSDERTQEAQRLTAKQIELRDAALVRDIPDWDKKVRQEVYDFAEKYGGVAKADLEKNPDARIFKMLRYAKLGFDAEQRSKAAKAVEAQQETRPATTVAATQRSGSVSASSQASMRLSADEWAAKRNREVAEQARQSRTRR